MNIFTHLYISARLKRDIEAAIPVKLDTFDFLLGSIRPDISSEYESIPHFKKDAEEFIRKELQSLLEENIFENRKCGSSFSERLGIIVHYLSDFFCFAHSAGFKGSLFDHHKYEMQLFTCFVVNLKKFTGRYRSRNGSGSSHIVIRHNASSILKHIDRLHEEYLENRFTEPGLNDVAFTYKACVSLCLSVVSACFTSEESFFEANGEAFS